MLNTGDDLTLQGLNLCKAIAELNVDTTTKELSTLTELYNKTDKVVVSLVTPSWHDSAPFTHALSRTVILPPSTRQMLKDTKQLFGLSTTGT